MDRKYRKRFLSKESTRLECLSQATKNLVIKALPQYKVETVLSNSGASAIVWFRNMDPQQGTD